MITGYITHDEAMVRDFMEDPEYAEELLAMVTSDGDEYEIGRVKGWQKEAKSRVKAERYWDDIIENAEKTAKSGWQVDRAISLLDKARAILKAAVPAGA